METEEAAAPASNALVRFERLVERAPLIAASGRVTTASASSTTAPTIAVAIVGNSHGGRHDSNEMNATAHNERDE